MKHFKFACFKRPNSRHTQLEATLKIGDQTFEIQDATISIASKRPTPEQGEQNMVTEVFAFEDKVSMEIVQREFHAWVAKTTSAAFWAVKDPSYDPKKARVSIGGREVEPFHTDPPGDGGKADPPPPKDDDDDDDEEKPKRKRRNG